MDLTLQSRAAVLDRHLTAWNEGDADSVLALITTDYVGRTLHLASGLRATPE